MEWAHWFAGVDHQSCNVCREGFEPHWLDTPEETEEKKKGPPCITCRPEWWPVNGDALQVYQQCSGQLITAGMTGHVIDISIPAVLDVIRLRRIRDELDCLEDVQIIAREVIRVQREAREADEEA